MKSVVASTPYMTVRINNMREVSPGIFELTGVTHRVPAWDDVAVAMGYVGALPAALRVEIEDAILRNDVAQFLADIMPRR